jgi:hypothetical protein
MEANARLAYWLLVKKNKNFSLRNYEKIIKLCSLADSLSLQSLGSPIVPSNSGGFSETASRTTFMSYVVCASAAAPAHDMDSFALALTH